MVNIANQKLSMTDSLSIYGDSLSPFLSAILTKHKIKETSSKGNIWRPFYVPKGEGLCQLKNDKTLCNIYIYI